MHGVYVTFISFIMSSSHDLYDESMSGSKKIVLELYLREQGQIFSHMLYDVSGVGYGTIMVQRGYSLALDDLEVLPLWKELLVCSNIMEDVFDKDHVKEMSYELVGAYLHRPTMLFL